MSYVLGLDLGTSSLKGLLIDKNTNLVYEASYEYTFYSPKPSYSEQNPEEWILALNSIMEEIKSKVIDFGENLEAISISGQMHGLVMLDEYNNVIRPAILWNDTRTSKQCENILKDFGDKILSITKNRPLEGFTLPKILWVQENEPNLWEQVKHIMLPKDYVVWYLTEKYSTDFSDAAGTLMLDLKNCKWSEAIIEKYKIEKMYLPSIYKSEEFVGEVTDALSLKWQLKNIVKVAAGGADNACAALGAGIVSSEIALVSIGTSGVFLSYEDQPHDNYNGMLHLFNHAISGGYYSMGVTLSAGHSLEWFRRTFAKGKTFKELLENIDNINVGCDGLLFTPYIVGERTPYADSKIRGSFIGIDTNHNLDHFTRAVIEGITFSLKDSQVLMEKVANKKFSKIISVGGGAKNKEWLQMQADIFSCEILQLESEQGPGQGAAFLAMIVAGWYQSLEECVTKNVHYKDSILPNTLATIEYDKVYEKYRKIYKATKEICV